MLINLLSKLEKGFDEKHAALMSFNKLKWRREGDDYEYRVSEWLNANTLKGLHEKNVSLAFFDPKIDIQALFKSQKFMYN